MATTTYTPITTQTLSSDQPNITFTNIDSSYTDLIIVGKIKVNTNSFGSRQLRVQVGNGSIDTNSNYSVMGVLGYGSGYDTNRMTNQNNIAFGVVPTNTASGVWGTVILHFNNYSNTTTNKTVLARTSDPSDWIYAGIGSWRSNSAINQIKFYTTGSSGETLNFLTGTTLTIYGIANANTGAKATGGIITYDNTYYYHTFGASGTFTPNQNLTNVDYLVVAGGGGGGGYIGGGGGAGGLRSTVDATGGGGSLESKISLNSGTAYTITVGAGGNGGSWSTDNATQGGTSSIAGSGLTTITSTGGGKGGNGAGGAGGSGGSGGGGAYVAAGGSRTINQGYVGGQRSGGDTNDAASGGGGAGQAGAGYLTSPTNSGGEGGNGVAIPNMATATGTGVSTYYAGGGGGGWANINARGGYGGAGGGGNGGYGDGGGGGQYSATAAIANTGGGGGGQGQGGQAGSAGGSGIVIIRYAK